MSAARLTITSLDKTFGASTVLSGVGLSIAAGEIHGLAGQNGSGKSTLIKILTAVYTPNPGATYRVDGKDMHLPVRWRQVHAAGVSVVHQDLGLLDHLTVAENICIGGFPTKRGLGRIDRRERDRLAASTLERLGSGVDPAQPVAGLNAPDRAEVAIARAIRDQVDGSGLVILDEATRALSGPDLDRVHAVLRAVAARGGAVLMISHNLPELIAITDRITILRDGRAVGSGLLTRDLREQDLARRMLGSTLAAVGRADKAPVRAQHKRTVVSVAAVGGARARNVEFDVTPGEIVGITGMPGSGYEEIPYLVTGATAATSGRLRTAGGGLDLTRAGVRGCLRARVVLVPERRERDGLAFEQSLRNNISLPSLPSNSGRWFLGRRWQRRQTATAIAELGIRPNQPDLLVKQLSGGNQQKVLLAKWLAFAPTLLVLHEPTQAVDVAARRDILLALRRSADSGLAVLMVTSEPEDLAAVCDRVLIYRDRGGLRPARGRTSDELIEEVYSSTDHVAATTIGAGS